MFRNARRIAAITVLTAAAATLPAGSASAITMSDVMVSSVTAAPAAPGGAAPAVELAAPTAEPAALLVPAVQSAREAAGR